MEILLGSVYFFLLKSGRCDQIYGWQTKLFGEKYNQLKPTNWHMHTLCTDTQTRAHMACAPQWSMTPSHCLHATHTRRIYSIKVKFRRGWRQATTRWQAHTKDGTVRREQERIYYLLIIRTFIPLSPYRIDTCAMHMYEIRIILYSICV